MKLLRVLTITAALLLLAVNPALAAPRLQGGEIQYGDTITGTLSNTEGDHWTFTGSAGDAVLISLDSTEFDPYLELRDAQDVEVGSNDDGGEGTNALLSVVLPTDGLYTIIARSFSSGQGAYTLSLQMADIRSIEYDSPVNETLSNPAGDRWSFTASNGDRVHITLDSDAFDPYLELFGPSGTLVASDDDGGTDLNAMIDTLVSASGEYMIVARSYRGNGTGAYTLGLFQGQAQQIQPIEYGQTVNGDLQTDEGDRWTFTGTEGDAVLIGMESDAIDSYVEVLDASGYSVASNDDGGDGYNSLLGYTLSASGEYTIIARSFSTGSTGSYTLSLNLYEPRTDTAIAYGDSVNSMLLVPEGERWTFSGSAGDTINILMQSDTFDTYVSLVDASGTELAYNDDAGWTGRSMILYTLPAAGEYTIVASSYSSGSTGPYSLALAQVTQQPIEFGQTLTQSLGNAAGDYWIFTGRAGDGIRIEMSSTDFDSYLELYGPDGEQLSTNDDGGGSLNSLLAYALPTSGEYTIVARPLSSGTGSYTISLGIIEPRSQTTIALNETVDSFLLDPEEGERWTFEGTADQVIDVVMESQSFDTYLVLVDARGRELASNDDAGSTQRSEIVSRLPAAGEYTIVARAFSNGTGAYTLRVSEAVIHLIEYGQTVESDLADPLGGDRWSFTGQAGDVVIILLDTESYDLTMRLLDSTGVEVAWSDYSGTDSRPMIGYTLPSTGDYTIWVTSYYSEAVTSYSLTLNVQQPRTTDVLEYDQEVTSALSSGQDETWRFTGAEGDTVRITMESVGFDSQLSLQDATGSELASNDDAGSTRRSEILYTLPAAGEYVVVASTFGDYQASGIYTLIVRQAEVRGIEIGQSIDSTVLDPAGDYWRFTGEEGDAISIFMISDDFDTYLELYSEDGTLLLSNDDGAGNLDSLITYTLAETGAYSIVARPLDRQTTGSYTLAINRTVVTPIEIGQTITQTALALGGDRYTFYAEPGIGYDITMQSDTFEPSLELWDANGYSISYGTNSGGMSARLATTVTQSGTYTIVARSIGPDPQGGYTLTLGVVEPRTSDVIAYAETASSILLDTAGEDWHFEGTAGDSIMIRMSSTSLDSYLELYDPAGVMVASNDDSGGSLNAAIRYTLVESGDYRIVARTFGSTSTGGLYDLTLSTITSTAIEPGQMLDTTVVDPTGDIYTFSAANADHVQIRMESTDFDSYLELYGPDGTMVMSNDDGAGNLNSLIDTILYSSGEYMIIARPLNSSSSGDYRLTLAINGTLIPSTPSYGGMVPSPSVIVVTATPAPFATEVVNPQTIILGETRVDMGLAEAGDQWAFEGRGGETVLVEVRSYDFDPVIELYDSNHNLIAPVETDTQFPGFTLPANGFYLIQIGSTDSRLGAYSLALLPAP